MHLVSAGMGLLARLVLSTCIRLGSHGVCLQVCIMLACSVSLFYHNMIMKAVRHGYGWVAWVTCIYYNYVCMSVLVVPAYFTSVYATDDNEDISYDD